jgi:thioredoxin 1
MPEDAEHGRPRAKRKEEAVEKRAEAAPWPDGPVPLTDATFDEFVGKYPRAVVDCWAEWCGPCRMIAPHIEALAKAHKGRIAYGKLNVDSNPRITGRFNVMSIPTLLVFLDGALKETLVGAMPRSELEQQVLAMLK